MFEKGANTLGLADAAGVAAHITDFGTGDAIDLLGTTANKLSYANGALTVDNGTKKIATLQIKGSYTTANFKLASDGHGGSLISYVSNGATEPRPIGGPVGWILPSHLVAG